MAKSLDIIDPKKELTTEEDRSEEEEMMQAAPRHKDEEGGGLFYLIIGIIAVIVSTSLALYILFKDDKSSDKAAAPATTSTASATTSATPTATTTASVATSAVASPVVTTSSASATFKYTSEQIRIANGNGISGEAAKVQQLLEGKGYKIASVGNATKQYESTIVYYKTGQEKLAEALKKDISTLYSVSIQNSDSIVGSYDAVIALGAK